MNLNKDPIEPAQSDFDTASALADISSDLFGQGEEGKSVNSEEVVPEGRAEKVPADTSSAVEPSQPAHTEGTEAEANSQAVQAVGAPETWTKEAIAKWATIDPTVQQEILKREQDIFKGIAEYKGRAEIGDRYTKVIEPYQPVLAAEGVDPVEMFKNFSANHYMLSRGTPEQKTQLGAMLVQSYGLDLIAIAKLMDSQGSYRQPNSESQALQARVNELERARQTDTFRSQQEVQARIAGEVSAFANDPAHQYFNELTDDIAKLIQTGVATTLQDAYDKAVYANPTTRQKEIDRLTAEAAASERGRLNRRGQKVAAATAADIRANPKPRGGTTPTGSMDDTMAETLAAIKQRSN